MTPEERAQRLFDKWHTDEDSNVAPVSTFLMHAAAAIRTAENEALERAAQALADDDDGCRDEKGICIFCTQRHRHRRLVLSFKHPEGER